MTPGTDLVIGLVAVDGIDGSGKSVFADALVQRCGAGGSPATLVRVDDFRRPELLADADAASEAREADVYYDRYYDFAAIDRRLDELAVGGAPLIVIEGVFVLRARRTAGAPLIVLEVDVDVACERVRARDVARGRTLEEVERRIQRRYLPGQARYRAELDPVTRADLLLDNRDPARPIVLRRAPGRFPAAVERALAQIL